MIRFSGVVLLGLLASQTFAASIAELRTQLASDKPLVRQKAADGLGDAGKQAADAAPDLVGALSDTVQAVRSRAVIALGKIGNKASLPALDFLTRDPLENAAMKKAAHDAIAKLGALSDEETEWLEANRKSFIVKGKLFKLPPIDLARRATQRVGAPFKLGECGMMRHQYLVEQVLDGKNMLISDPFDHQAMPVLAHGFSTANLADRTDRWMPTEPVIAVGTSSYTDVLGGRTTVITIVPIPLLRKGFTLEEFRKLEK